MSTSFLHLHGADFTNPGGTDPVLHGLTLTLPSGWTGVVGANGAGKSTLVRHLLTVHTLPAERVACLPQEIGRKACRALLAEAHRLPPRRLGRLMSLVRRLGSDPARLLQSGEPSPGETRKLMRTLQLEEDLHARGPAPKG